MIFRRRTHKNSLFGSIDLTPFSNIRNSFEENLNEKLMQQTEFDCRGESYNVEIIVEQLVNLQLLAVDKLIDYHLSSP